MDALLIGEVSSFTPEKETTTIAKTQNTYIEPTYGARTTIVNGQQVESIYQTGTTMRREKNITPVTYTEAPKVGLIGKLVDVETAQVIWVGSITRDGDNDMEAAENCVDYLISNLHKDINSVLQLKNK